MREPATISDRVRAVFEARKDEALTHAQLFDAMGLPPANLCGDRDTTRDVLKYLVQTGYLLKVGSGRTSTYRYSGQGMRSALATLSDEERRQRRNERRRKCADQRAGDPVQRAPRERRMDGNTVARPRAAKRSDYAGPAETLEQFVARGGRVQRLPASWERTA